jgi:hypothetical protein
VIEPRLFLCSGASGDDKHRKIERLDTSGPDPNVTIKLRDFARIFHADPPSRIVDLLEIASYVYAADAGTIRGTQWQAEAVEAWDRDFKFIIPVRDIEFWSDDTVKQRLIAILTFLTTDAYQFDFVRLDQPREVQGYLEFGDLEWTAEQVDRVTMFSGGLDSLSGAVQAAAIGQPLVLVSHRAAPQLSARQRKLFQALRRAYPAVPMLHVPVWVNKHNKYGHEPTQRTRSFLFGALGLAVAEMIGCRAVRFYENGVISLNLPIADEVVRARASRTTHPYTLQQMADLAAAVTEHPFVVDNPYLYSTKADVITTILSHNRGDLIGLSVSCAHTMFKSASQQHCGSCSQCIDRRVGILAAGAAAWDPVTDYVQDVFVGARPKPQDQNMAIHFARHALELRRMSADQFGQAFNLELSRAIRAEPDSHEAAERIYDLHQRYATNVVEVLSDQIRIHSTALLAGTLPSTSFLRSIAGAQHTSPIWDRAASRICEILQRGLPVACQGHPPKNEPALQKIADGLLRASDADLTREFPFVRWSASAARPDWSSDTFGMFVEMKYVRGPRTIRAITEAIAADITQYGQNGARVLFVIYDPTHAIADDRELAKDIEAHSEMRVCFIR